ncbi:hypothetical protein SUGI_0598690 [Cryptomeria japonica]|nr:hypothetical protein SUGI_0598690 [Cryptomeria japonica]
MSRDKIDGGEESNSDSEADSPPPHKKDKSVISPKAKSFVGKGKKVRKQLVVSSSSTSSGKDSPVSSGKNANSEVSMGGSMDDIKTDSQNIDKPLLPPPSSPRHNATKDLHAKSVELISFNIYFDSTLLCSTLIISININIGGALPLYSRKVG